jgi:hypothetical protein
VTVALVVGGSGKRRAFGPFATEVAAWDWADAKYPNHRVQVLTIVPVEVAERLGLAPGETLGEWMDRVTGEEAPDYALVDEITGTKTDPGPPVTWTRVPDPPAIDGPAPETDWHGRELPSGE